MSKLKKISFVFLLCIIVLSCSIGFATDFKGLTPEKIAEGYNYVINETMSYSTRSAFLLRKQHSENNATIYWSNNLTALLKVT